MAFECRQIAGIFNLGLRIIIKVYHCLIYKISIMARIKSLQQRI